MDRAQLHAEIAAGFYERGQMEVALQELEEAVKLDAKNAKIYNVYGLVYAVLGQDANAERNFQQERGGQWTKGKSADTFGPIGPWLVTADEVADPQALLGIAVMALAAALLGIILRVHPALALVGAMVWSAAVAAAFEVVGNGAQGGAVSAVVLAAGLAVAAVAARGKRGSEPRPSPLARAHPALHGGGQPASSL